MSHLLTSDGMRCTNRHMSISDEEKRARLDWRYVHDPCLICDGSGVRTYSAFATWQGGLSGGDSRPDVCDACWGTGDRFRHGANLRQLRDHEAARIAEAAVTALAESVGADGHPIRAVHALIAALRRLAEPSKGRRAPMEDDISFAPIVRALADQLELASKAPRATGQRRFRPERQPEAERLIRAGYRLGSHRGPELGQLEELIAVETANNPRRSSR